MPTHAEQRRLPYSPEQLFDLVADIEAYPQFLPWCVACRVTRREGNVLHGDLVIGYKLMRERFKSRVTLERPNHIRVEYLDGPLKYLSNHWKFIPEADGGCTIDFFVDFEFRNPVFKGLMGLFFNEAVRRMVAAFEARARALYALDVAVPVSPSK